MADIQHVDLTSIHRFAYVGGSDPGAVGAFKGWVDTSVSPAKFKYRNSVNTNWVEIGIWDTDLIAIAGLSPANNDVLQYKGGAWTNRTPNQLKTDLNLIIGANVQPYSLTLELLGFLTPATDRLPYFSGAGAVNTTTLTAFGRSLIDDNTASAARATLGLGNMAIQSNTDVLIFGGAATFNFEGFSLGTENIGKLTFIIEELLANKQLSINVNNANRSISLNGNLTVSAGGATISGNNTGNELPSQIGNATKVLTTNGTIQSWGTAAMYGANVANLTSRLGVLDIAKYYHVKQDDNGLAYVLTLAADSGEDTVDTSWIALPKPGRQTFKGFVLQTGTSTPTWSIAENGLQGTPSWSRGGVGDYVITLTGGFPVSKFFCPGGVWFTDGSNTIVYSLTRINNNSAQLTVTNLTASTSAPIEISTVLGDYTLDSLPIDWYVYQ